MRPRNRASQSQSDSAKIRRELSSIYSPRQSGRLSSIGRVMTEYEIHSIQENLKIIDEESQRLATSEQPLNPSKAYIAARTVLIDFIVDKLAFSRDAADAFMDILIEKGAGDIIANIDENSRAVVSTTPAGHEVEADGVRNLKNYLIFPTTWKRPLFENNADKIVITYRGLEAEAHARRAKMILSAAKDEFGIDGHYPSHRLVPEGEGVIGLVTVPQSVFDNIAAKKLYEPELFESAIRAASGRQRP